MLTYQISDENLEVLCSLMDMHLNHKKLTPNLDASQGLRFMANSDLCSKYKLTW